MRLSSLGISAGFHIAAVIVTMVSLPWLKKDFEIPAPVMVEFVELGKVTETTKVATPTPEKKEEKKDEPPPPPAPKNTAKEPTPPAPKKPEPKPKKDEKKDAKPEVDPLAKADKKPPPKKEEKKEPKKDDASDFNSLLKNLADSKPAPASDATQPDMGLKTATPDSGAKAPLGQKMTMSEEDALRRQLEGCWNFPAGAKDAEDLNVEIYMVINPDRTLRDARVVDTARYNRDGFFRAAADSALRAVRNPSCSPFALPPDKYDVWKTTVVNFNPREMF